MEEQEYMYVSPTLGANLNYMRLTGKLCDVNIEVEDRTIRAHKVILAANLKYFASMFLNPFQERQRDVVTMENIRGSDLEAFINYAYTGGILLTDNNALGLLELADYLNEDWIKEACIDFLEEHLKTKDAFRAYKFAHAIECVSLENVAKSRILSKFRTSSLTSEYLDLDFESLRNLLIDVRLEYGKSQQIFFKGIVGWLMHAPADRRAHMDDLLASIDIAKVTSSYLVKCLGSLSNTKNDYGIIKDIMFCYHTSTMKNENQTHELIILGTTYYDLCFQSYNFTKSVWQNNYVDARECFQSNCAILNDKLYYVSEIKNILQLQVFDPNTNKNISLDISNSLTRNAAICACSQFVYLCGGYDERLVSSMEVTRYDPVVNDFKMLPPMQTGRWNAAATFLGDSLVVLGGKDHRNYCLNSVENYDPDTKKWTSLAPMCEKRYWHAVAVLEGKIYACGGWDKKSVEVYDPSIKRWCPVSDMNKARYDFLVVVHEEKLLAVGGDDENTVEVYDPSENYWQIDDEMSSELRVSHPIGGLISASCITNN